MGQLPRNAHRGTPDYPDPDSEGQHLVAALNETGLLPRARAGLSDLRPPVEPHGTARELEERSLVDRSEELQHREDTAVVVG